MAKLLYKLLLPTALIGSVAASTITTGIVPTQKREAISSGTKFVEQHGYPTGAGEMAHTMLQVGSTLLVGTIGAGLWMSTNNGVTFTQNKDIPSYTQIQTILKIKNIIFVSTGMDAPTGLWQSTDNGKTFTKNHNFKSYIQQMFYVNNILYLGTGSGAFQSTNLGKTFTLIPGIPATAQTSAVFYVNNVFFVNSKNGTYLSANQGKTFTLIKQKLLFTRMRGADNVIFGSSIPNRIYQSYDGGVTWKQAPDISGTATLYGLNYISNTLYLSTNTGLFTSTNKGETYKKVLNVSCAADILNIHNKMYIQTVGTGLYESDDQGKTFFQNKTVSSKHYNSVGDLYANTTTIFLAAGAYDPTVTPVVNNSSFYTAKI